MLVMTTINSHHFTTVRISALPNRYIIAGNINGSKSLLLNNIFCCFIEFAVLLPENNHIYRYIYKWKCLILILKYFYLVINWSKNTNPYIIGPYIHDAYRWIRFFASGNQHRNGSNSVISRSNNEFGYRWWDNACDIRHSL